MPGLFDLKTYKQYFTFIRDFRAATKIYPSLKVAWLPIILIIGAIGWYANNFYYQDKTGKVLSANTTQITNYNGANKELLADCKNAQFDSSEWNLSQYKGPNNEGYFCPKLYSGFLFPQMMYDKLITGNFQYINLTAQVINKSNKNAMPGPLILSLSNDEPVWQLYAFEKNPYLVGFELGILNKEKGEIILERQEPQTLKAPVEYGTPIDIKVKPITIQQNNTSFAFDFSYINQDSGGQVNQTLSYNNLVIPYPNFSSTNLKFGLGTSKDTCIKPVSIKVCY